MQIRPHSLAWYDRLATLQSGYYYPWKSILPALNGEDTYLEMVAQHLFPEADVLDVGCGHGEVALDFASRCRSILAYDRVADYICLAEEARQRRGVTNVLFLCADSSAEANGGKPRIPAEPASFDLLISRRGPINWIEDARRVARPGAVLIQLNPQPLPAPAWNGELPEPLRIPPPMVGPFREVIEPRLALSGLELHSCWSFDVPEIFPDPRELYVFLSWGFLPGEVPAYAEVQADLESLFARHAGAGGLVLRRERFLWKAVVE
jgi:SAM-dependent methyltransferase